MMENDMRGTLTGVLSGCGDAWDRQGTDVITCFYYHFKQKKAEVVCIHLKDSGHVHLTIE